MAGNLLKSTKVFRCPSPLSSPNMGVCLTPKIWAVCVGHTSEEVGGREESERWRNLREKLERGWPDDRNDTKMRRKRWVDERIRGCWRWRGEEVGLQWFRGWTVWKWRSRCHRFESIHSQSGEPRTTDRLLAFNSSLQSIFGTVACDQCPAGAVDMTQKHPSERGFHSHALQELPLNP